MVAALKYEFREINSILDIEEMGKTGKIADLRFLRGLQRFSLTLPRLTPRGSRTN